jgi:tRNA(Ile)-lysidine synthase
MRNRVRHGILPRLERYLNPAVREAFAETAEIARSEEEYWEKEVARVLPRVWDPKDAGGVLSLSVLADLPLALQRRLVRAASESLGMRLDFHHVEEVLALGSAHVGPAKSTTLPDGWVVLRNKGELRFEMQSDTSDKMDYEYRLPVPGSVEVLETESRFEVVLVSGKAAEGYNPEDLLDRALLASDLRVRNWRAGDRFWPAHTKCTKKIKELLQERRVAGLERNLWPVVVSGSDVVWVRGFPASRQLRPRSQEAVLIREVRM